ncbi:MAG: hypothetical protein CBD18_07990 [Opitutales bacterium TMED158]|nr:MAG: hypothetical protein CBD18_07990 [Opitutales bacterium TMED158]
MKKSNAIRLIRPLALFGLLATRMFTAVADGPLVSLTMSDLSEFRPVAENWRVAGEVTVDRSGPKLMSGSSGEGILVCSPTETAKDNLFTKLEHGDIELDLEVMVPVSSNSGLYFQGRYEIQILDSWGTQKLRHADIGGIYQRWDPARGKGKEGYEGHPPRLNAARAPGEWQRFKIRFRAPRFDEAGNKTAHARFESVWLNGSLLHENVEVTGPTRSSPFESEVERGPLMIQGDHGPVALRNARYTLLN